MAERVYLGLGSNLGRREENIREALERLGEGVIVERVSSLYESEPLGYREQPWFLNAVVQASTELDPWALLSFLKRIERAMGRGPSFPDSPRPLDIDILLYGDLILESPELIIPHPRLARRLFVLLPLAELAPELIHPVAQKSIVELLLDLKGEEGSQRCTKYLSGSISMRLTT